jgi:hypothetical protein
MGSGPSHSGRFKSFFASIFGAATIVVVGIPAATATATVPFLPSAFANY